MRASVGKRHYREHTTKHYASKSDAELMRLREKYKDGVPPEIIDHLAAKLSAALLEEGRCVGED